MEWTLALGEQERHNVTVIKVGSNCYSLCSISSSLSHAKLEQPFSNPCNKVRGKYFIKKSSCVFPRASVCILHEYVYVHIIIYMYISAWISRWQYNIVNDWKETGMDVLSIQQFFGGVFLPKETSLLWKHLCAIKSMADIWLRHLSSSTT